MQTKISAQVEGFVVLILAIRIFREWKKHSDFWHKVHKGKKYDIFFTESERIIVVIQSKTLNLLNRPRRVEPDVYV